MKVLEASNQSGVPRGLFSEDELSVFRAEMRCQSAGQGAFIDAIAYRPQHPGATVQRYRAVCTCRKPAAGLLHHLMLACGLDKRVILMVGDRESDKGAAANASVFGLLSRGGNLLQGFMQAGSLALDQWLVLLGPELQCQQLFINMHYPPETVRNRPQHNPYRSKILLLHADTLLGTDDTLAQHLPRLIEDDLFVAHADNVDKCILAAADIFDIHRDITPRPLGHMSIWRITNYHGDNGIPDTLNSAHVEFRNSLNRFRQRTSVRGTEKYRRRTLQPRTHYVYPPLFSVRVSAFYAGKQSTFSYSRAR